MKTFSLYALICLIGSNVFAEYSVVSVRTMKLGSGEVPESWVILEGASKSVKLTWPVTQPSEPLSVIHDGSLKLLKSCELPEGETAPEAVSAVKLPASAKEVLLLGIADAGAVEYMVIEDVFMEAKFNDWLVINISDQVVEMRVGNEDSELRIGAGDSAIFRPEVEEGSGVKIIARGERKGEMKPFFSSYWSSISGQRIIMIYYRDGERMRVRRIGDRFIQAR